jgi:hypothetical protein
MNAEDEVSLVQWASAMYTSVVHRHASTKLELDNSVNRMGEI